MRNSIRMMVLVGAAMVATACDRQADVTRAVGLAAREEADGIRQVMLTVAEPREAVAYFTRQMQAEPDNLEHRRDLARSLVRGDRAAEAAVAWRRIVEDGGGPEDGVALAGALVRDGDWSGARIVLDAVPPTHESFARYRLEALVADSERDWARADSFYEIAADLTTTPAGLFNNWGYSKLSRGDAASAEPLFVEAITYDDALFTAKANLVIARASRGAYRLPGIPMDEEERARLLHTSALVAIRQGDAGIGRKLLEDAIDAHPRHFEPAHRALRDLDA